MLTTDKGTFKVNNGLLIWTWNEDEIYGQIEVGKTYEFTTKGNRVVFLCILQYYPYITNVKLVK